MCRRGTREWPEDSELFADAIQDVTEQDEFAGGAPSVADAEPMDVLGES